MNKANSKAIILLVVALAFMVPIVAQMQSSVGVSNTPTTNNNVRSTLEDSPEKPVLPEAPKISPELEAKLVALLKTVGRESAALNLPESRIRYQTDAADMLWARDEKIARELFASAAGDLRGSMQSLDAAHQQRESGENEDESFGGAFFGGGRGSSGKAYTVNAVRQNLLLTWAKRDGEAALALFRETQRDNFKESGWNDQAFEAKLGSVIAKNDPARALEIGERKLSKNDFDGIDNLIVDLYRKDAGKGARLASETVKKIKTAEAPLIMYGVDPLNSIFDKAAEISESTPAGTDKPPLLSETDLRELAEAIIKKRLQRFKDEGSSPYYYGGSSDTSERLKKYAPASFARLERATNSSMMGNSNTSMRGGRRNSNVAIMTNSGMSSSSMSNSNSSMSSINGNMANAPMSPRESIEQAQSAAVSKLTAMAMSPDAQISLEEVRKDLSAIRNRQQKLFALTQIAKLLATRGDKESAKQLLADVADMQVAQPRKAMETLHNLMLADAYSAIEPDRAFTIMESTIFEFNSVAAALNRMVEFVDIKEVADGEFNMGIVPNEALQAASLIGLRQPLFNLATADFERTAALADKFDKTELRVEAKMLIVRTLLPLEK